MRPPDSPGQRLPSPNMPASTGDVLVDLEREKNRQQRPVNPTATTARRVAVGVYQSDEVLTPTTINVPIPSDCTWFIVSVKFTDADPGAQGVAIGPSNDFAYPAPYVDGGSVQYSWPAHGATTHSIHARITGSGGDVVGKAKATIYTF